MTKKQMNKLNLIIPLCNMNDDGYDERLHNLKLIINNLPYFIHLILVEQIINSNKKLYTGSKFNYYIEQHSKKFYPNCFTYSIIHINYPIFNKSWCYNVGANTSISDYLLFGESDIFVDESYYEKLMTFISNIGALKWFYAWNNLHYLDKDNFTIIRNTVPQKGMAEGGLCFFNKKFFWSIGGYNEHIQELGGIDNEIIRRAEFITNSYPMFDYTIIHKWHPIHNLKKDKWKNSTHRKHNRKIYNYTKQYPQKIINILKKYNQGQLQQPCCTTNNLYNIIK